MKERKKFCSKCGNEITDPKAKACEGCGAKLKKPLYKAWWFWVLMGLATLIVIAAFGSTDSETDTETPTQSTSSIDENNEQGTQINKYTTVDLQKMFDDLDENAMKAESTYQNMYVEVTGKIAVIDSDGVYISIEPVNASEWNFDTVTCYLKNDAQRDVIMNKSKGDTVTIKGKIISVGEILGYSINIDEVK